MHTLRAIVAVLFAQASLGLLIPPIDESGMKILDGDEDLDTCPPRLSAFCCYSLDYSTMEVECIGPGKVDKLSDCLEYEPRPMCCCGHGKIEKYPWIPKEISCDKDCQLLARQNQELV